MDDGTAVIDCTLRQPPAKKPPANAKPEPLDAPKPIAFVGHSVCIVGKVRLQYGTRHILVDTLGESFTFNLSGLLIVK